jgi:hypothetical protein
MPISINLLAEAHAEEELRRKDPVKRSLFTGSFLVAGFLVWYSSIWANTLWEKRTLSGLDEQIQMKNNVYGEALLNQKKSQEASKRLEALSKLNYVRFLQGNLLDAFQRIYVPNVQLTRVRIEQSAALTQPGASTTNSYGVVIPGKPGSTVMRMTMSLDAKDSSPNPGDQIGKYKETLVSQNYFKTLLDRTNGVHLVNTSSPMASADGKPYVMFTLECKFNDQQR